MNTPSKARPKLRGYQGLLLGILVLVLALGGVAVAMWTANGEGNGDAHAVTAVNVTLTGTTGTPDLYPGFTAGDIHFLATNTNPYPVNFTAFTIGTISSSDSIGCPATNVAVTPAAINISLFAGETATPRSIANVVSMASLAPNGCQGATFTIVLHLTGSQT